MSELKSGSMTARFVASGLVLLKAGDEPGSEFVSPAASGAADRFLAAAQPRWQRSLTASLARLKLALREGLIIPGLACHQALRKHWIGREVRAAVEAGAKRVVVLGGGYDPLTTELATEHPGLELLELDHPSTQAAKRAGLAELGLDDAIELAPLDLEHASLEDALAAHASAGERCVYVAEGLLMYFDRAQVEGMIRDLGRHAGPGSDLLFTYMEPDARGGLNYRSATAFARGLLRLRGERLRWGCSRHELAGFLAGLGFALEETWGADELGRRYGLPPETRIARGECVARARLR